MAYSFTNNKTFENTLIFIVIQDWRLKGSSLVISQGNDAKIDGFQQLGLIIDKCSKLALIDSLR